MTQPDTPPEINYLAKDYAGFRQLLLDHLSLWLPGWAEQHPADLGHTLVDVLAYAADYLSYYQDAVATEAYLGTARLRRSVKRHVRMLDYAWHEGCNARVWVQVQVKDSQIFLPKGTQLFTRQDGGGTMTVIPPGSPDYAGALARSPAVFETMLDIDLHAAHNQIHFYPLGWMEAGATRAVLLYPEQELKLHVGHVLIFEEILDPQTGRKEGADPGHRHAVRLTRVNDLSSIWEVEHALPVEIEWGAEDALPFDLCLSASYDGIHTVETSVALGNIVLADHGRTIEDEELPGLPASGRYYPHLRHRDLTFSEPFHSQHTTVWPAKEMLSQEPHRALPCLALCELGAQPLRADGRALLPLKNFRGLSYPVKHWVVRSELISSGSYERDFAVEIEDDGRAYLRFGFLGAGWRPEVAGAPFLATYRTGSGSAGNAGRETIAHIVTAVQGITGVRNPLPAQGGVDPVRTEVARRHAPQAYRASTPCVTPSDYAQVAERHPQVARAAAELHWTGSRRTVFVCVQRRGGRPIDEDFRRALAGFLERFRLAGLDLEIREAQFVPLEIALDIHLQPHHRAGIVGAALRQAFSDTCLPGEQAGFFHPPRWTFGQAVYRSQVIARAMGVPGVARVEVCKFRRTGAAHDEDPILVGPLEIVRLHGDPRDLSRGSIEFTLR